VAGFGEPADCLSAGGMATPSSVWLIRHGQSQANAGVATEHPSSIALTDLGHEQARMVSGQVQGIPDQVVVSPFIRTFHTAQPLLDKLEAEGARVPVLQWPIQEFTYLSPVRCRGTTAQDRKAWAQAYWERADPDWEDGDGAESFRQLMRRVDAFSMQLAASPGWSVVFGHGMFFKAFLIALEHGFDVSPLSMRRYRALESSAPIHNAQIIKLSARSGGGLEIAVGNPR
jgi:2,3-bisphosphoglycerate-dependent phosphoglycerate mutase